VTSSVQALCSKQRQLEADDVDSLAGKLQSRNVDDGQPADCVVQLVDVATPMTSQQLTSARPQSDIDRKKSPDRDRDERLTRQVAQLDTVVSRQVSSSLRPNGPTTIEITLHCHRKSTGFTLCTV